MSSRKTTLRASLTAHCIAMLAVALLIAGSTVAVEPEKPAAPNDAKPSFSFNDVKYFHRWSQGDQHEFTPKDQTDLDAWKDMVTIWRYPGTTDGDGLAQVANTVLSNYKAAHGHVFRTSSVPRTKDTPAEHFVAVIFSEETFEEIALARVKLENGVGVSIVYSRRFYGKNAKDQVRDWLPKNGLATEKALMKWNEFPKLDAVK